MAVTSQDRFANLVDAKLRDAIVQKNGFVWNNRYEGNPKAGAVKIPVRDTEAVVGDYAKDNASAGASLTQAVGSYLTLAINKDIAVNEKIDGYSVDSVPDNILADRLDSAGYSLALRMNADGTQELLNAEIIASTESLTKDNVYAQFVDLRTALSREKVPTQGRFALVAPEVYALLLKSPEFVKASDLGDAVVQSGAVGQTAGFLIFEDTSLPAVVSVIVGHPDWCTRVEEWAVSPKVQSLDGSGNFIGEVAIQGRKIYAHKLTKPQTARQITSVLAPTIEVTGGGATFTVTANAGNNLSGGTYTLEYKPNFIGNTATNVINTVGVPTSGTGITFASLATTNDTYTGDVKARVKLVLSGNTYYSGWVSTGTVVFTKS